MSSSGGRPPLTPAQKGAAATELLQYQAGKKDAIKAKVAAGVPSKDERAAMWDAAKGTPRPQPQASGPSRADIRHNRAEVQPLVRNAGTATRNTQNMPAKQDTFVSGRGNEVRKAVYNSNVHKAAPVGAYQDPSRQINVKPNPKHFGNYNYRGGSMNGNAKPLPNAPSGSRNGLAEYPVLANNNAGWHGDGPRGPVRVVHSSNTFYGVVTHPSRGSRRQDEFVQMNHRRGPPC